MKKYKKILIIAAVIIQCMALGAICFERESVLMTGETVYIRTVPVDPRDLFRGDYVRLNYGISTIPLEMVDKKKRKDFQKREKRVYLVYKTDARNMVVPLRLSLEKPAGETFIRGYTVRNWRNNSIGVRYSIEKYFMQQGKGLVLERGQRLEGVRIPLEMETAVGRGNGIAVLKGLRYSDLGLGIVLPGRGSTTEAPSFKIKVKLVNASDKPVYIVDPENHESFSIELSYSGTYKKEEKIKYQKPPVKPEFYTESDIREIAPKSLYEFTIDLDHPEYQLLRGTQEVSWSDMKYWENARIIYRAPEEASLMKIDDPGKLWQGHVMSRSFSGYSFRDL